MYIIYVYYICIVYTYIQTHMYISRNEAVEIFVRLSVLN